jgi:hypothetical protein
VGCGTVQLIRIRVQVELSRFTDDAQIVSRLAKAAAVELIGFMV